MTRTSISMPLITPDSLEPPLLEHAQQLHLHRHGDIADLVEEQGPPVGQLEPPLALGRRAGERALLMAEQLALEQRLGQRRAVDGHERPGTVSGRRLMDRLGDLLLAGPRLSLDQDGGRGLRDVPDQLEDVEHPRTLAEDVPERVPLADLGPEGGQFVLQGPFAQGALDQQAEMLGVGRLGQEIVGTHPHGLHGFIDTAMAGGHDDGHR